MSTIRLATNGPLMQNPEFAISKTLAPQVRLAVSPIAADSGANSVAHHVGAGGLGPAPSNGQAIREREAFSETPPVVRLAHKESQGDNTLRGERGVERIPDASAPALLVSYFYLGPFLKNQSRYCYRDWVLDSGAFSAHASGKVIELKAYIEKCLELLATDPTLTEVFALDVIGDHVASARNCDLMWEAGVPAIPCYHINEPESALLDMAKRFPKIAIGGVAKARGTIKLDFSKQCFARVWPKKIHGFGFGSETQVLALPWHSVDATNWEIGPCKYGRWQKYGGMSVRGSNQNLRSEVEHYLALERKARAKWKEEMKLLDSLGPTVRLVGASNQWREDQRAEAFAPPPAVRLVTAPMSPNQRAVKVLQKPIT